MKIKPLNWCADNDFDNLFDAHVSLGIEYNWLYYVGKGDEDREMDFRVFYEFGQNSNDQWIGFISICGEIVHLGRTFETKDDAQAACQQHYEDWLLSKFAEY